MKHRFDLILPVMWELKKQNLFSCLFSSGNLPGTVLHPCARWRRGIRLFPPSRPCCTHPVSACTFHNCWANWRISCKCLTTWQDQLSTSWTTWGQKEGKKTQVKNRFPRCDSHVPVQVQKPATGIAAVKQESHLITQWNYRHQDDSVLWPKRTVWRVLLLTGHADFFLSTGQQLYIYLLGALSTLSDWLVCPCKWSVYCASGNLLMSASQSCWANWESSASVALGGEGGVGGVVTTSSGDPSKNTEHIGEVTWAKKLMVSAHFLFSPCQNNLQQMIWMTERWPWELVMQVAWERCCVIMCHMATGFSPKQFEFTRVSGNKLCDMICRVETDDTQQSSNVRQFLVEPETSYIAPCSIWTWKLVCFHQQPTDQSHIHVYIWRHETFYRKKTKSNAASFLTASDPSCKLYANYSWWPPK